MKIDLKPQPKISEIIKNQIYIEKQKQYKN